MRTLLLASALALFAILSAAKAQSVYKCTHSDGSVSYQDRACRSNAQEKKVRVQTKQTASSRAGKTNFNVKVVELPEIGKAAIAVFDYMEISRSRGPGQRTQVLIKSKPSAAEMISMHLTFRPNPTGRIPARASREHEIQSIAQNYRPQLGVQLEFIDLNTKFGEGIVGLVNQPDSSAVVFEGTSYSTLVAGQIADTNVIVSMRIMTNGVDGGAFSDAMDIAKSLVVAEELAGVNQTPGEVSVPAAPDGFTWQQLPEITGVIPRPNGWFFETAHEAKSFRYHFSRTEGETGAEGYDAGLTISVNVNLPTSGDTPPSAHAEALIRDVSQGQEIIQPRFTGRRGNLLVHGVQIRVKDPDRGFYNAHMVAMTNIATGTVYFCIFQAPSGEWAEMWQIGQLMLSKLAITDSI